ncbi:hypothetical protein B5X24_HaOG200689 [Helicoverpa armigera]|uniref:Gustatory receptor n=1 Tax=Helicoverpa armigera TaxID=29058 RepID=A0A2W1BVQ4_HELAM|nr:hypothetical protein B5X24_HaOG200689 [Helicoverpa armigera]
MEGKTREKKFSCNYVDKDVRTIFRPLKIMQTCSFNPKYQFKNNFIYPANTISDVIAYFGVITFLTIMIWRITDILFDENLRRYQTLNFLYFASYADSLFYSFGYIMNLILHFLHSKDSVKMILIFQEIHRFIRKSASLKNIVCRNWVALALMGGFQSIVVIYLYIVYMHPPWYIIFYVFYLLSPDYNTVYAICFMKLLLDKAVLWNVNLLLSLQGQRKVLCRQMTRTYGQILDCFDVYKNVFELPVSTYKIFIC